MGKCHLLPFSGWFQPLLFQEDYGLQSVGPVCTTEIDFVTLQSSAAAAQQKGVSRGMGCGLKI